MINERVKKQLFVAREQIEKSIYAIGDLSMRDLHKSGINLAKIIESLENLEGIKIFLDETLYLDEAEKLEEKK